MDSSNTSDLPTTGQLFERYGPMVHRRCRDILGAEGALDAVQDVFLRVVEKRHLFRGESTPSTWLYGTATLLCLQRLRNRTSQEAKLRTLAAAMNHAGTANGAEDRLLVMRLLDCQPDDVRLMVYLRCVDEMTMDEVADIVGYSRKTVSQKVQHFLAAARTQLQSSEAMP